jgi:DNA-binding transcriptional MerR regulator
VTAAGRPAGDRLSIGAVLSRLREEFPDVTISKIRFLEAEGLVRPARTASGYRQFTAADVERLRFVLAAQRDRYLPLKVIKEQLDAADPARVLRAVPADGLPTAADFVEQPVRRMTREELLGHRRGPAGGARGLWPGQTGYRRSVRHCFGADRRDREGPGRVRYRTTAPARFPCGG